MNTAISGALITAVFFSYAMCEPMGDWIGCPWDGPPAAVNSVTLWDINGDGSGAVLPFLATDNGLYVKGLGGADIDVALFHGNRLTTITTWDRDGAGPMTPELVFVVQDSAFMSAEMYSVIYDEHGVLQISLLAIFESDVRGLTSYDTNGDGIDELVAVGAFESVVVDGMTTPLSKSAAFDASSWSQLGTAPNSTCEVAKVLACSPGNSSIPCEGDSTLVIGGFFTMAGGQNADGVACWDDSAGDWTSCGGGTALSGTTVVRDVAMWDSDDGPQLIVAGFGIQVDGIWADNIAHFDGTDWLPFGTGAWGNVQAVTSFDVDGDGTPEPVMAALFDEGGGLFVYKAVYWDGDQWLLLDDGEITSASNFVEVTDLLSVNADGAPPELIVVGEFDAVGPTAAENLAIWTPDNAGGPCDAADFAEPFGQHNFFDVSAFLSLFVAEDPSADFTGDGNYNFFDVQAFITAFVNGCP